MDIVKVFAPIAIKEATAYLSKRSTSPSTELATAASKGDTKAVTSLLSQDDRIDLAPALVAAATAGKLEVLDILIDPPQRPRSRASNSHHRENVKKTNVNVRSGDITPLIAAVQTQHIKTTELLLDAGADTSMALKNGETALHIAARTGDRPIVEALVDGDADLEIRDNWGNTPLLSAARFGHPHTLMDLLEKGADIEARDIKGSTALLLACRHDCVEAVKVLINSDANVRARDNRGRTALHRAIAGVDFIEGIGGKVKEDIVKLLLDAGADPRARDKEGRTATDMVGFLRGGDRVKRLLSPATSRHQSRERTHGTHGTHDRHDNGRGSRHHSRPGSPLVGELRHSKEPGHSRQGSRDVSPFVAL